MNERIWLTFDDGPDAEWTPRILDLLAAYGRTATFFVIGRNAIAHPDLLRRTRSAGHDIGNHTFGHRHPWWVSERTARSEVRDGAAAIADVLGEPAHWFRPPYGRLRPCVQEEVEALGQVIALWTLSAVDWGPFGAAHRIAARLARVRDGDVVLMHDGRGERNRPADLTLALPELLRCTGSLDSRPADCSAVQS